MRGKEIVGCVVENLIDLSVLSPTLSQTIKGGKDFCLPRHQLLVHVASCVPAEL